LTTVPNDIPIIGSEFHRSRQLFKRCLVSSRLPKQAGQVIACLGIIRIRFDKQSEYLFCFMHPAFLEGTLSIK
jgi:hypothetical protein